MWHFLWLVPLGFVVGAYGTLIGAGGGFVLMPALLLLYRGESPELLTSISLAVVFFNALSGSFAYARMGRIDYKSGLLFSTTTIPGAILGVFSVAYISQQLFDTIFGLLLIAMAIFLILHPKSEKVIRVIKTNHFIRKLVEANGTNHIFSYNPIIGIGLSLFVGYISSLLGIGGGIIHVPIMIYLLNFPAHIATATSHFTLAIMALTGTIVHISMGIFSHGLRRTIFLAIGVLLGAQLGAKLSKHIHGGWIIRGLAIALGFVGIRILMMAL